MTDSRHKFGKLLTLDVNSYDLDGCWVLVKWVTLTN